MHYYARILFNEPLEDVRDHCKRNRQWGCNPDFPFCRVLQGLDILDALLQLVEHDHRAFEQCVPVFRWLNALPAAIKKSYPKPMLKISNHFRYRRSGNTEFRRGSGHAAALRDGAEYVQVL